MNNILGNKHLLNKILKSSLICLVVYSHHVCLFTMLVNLLMNVFDDKGGGHPVELII